MTLTRAAALLLLPWMMMSCRTAKSVVAAVEVKPTTFLPHAAELKENRSRSPFLGNWWNPDKKVQEAAAKVQNIYIAPVVADELRPMKQFSARMEFSQKRRDAKVDKLLAYTREKFIAAFKSKKNSRYKVVDAPAKDAMTLRLSVIEWEPNTYSGLVVREALDMAIPVPMTPLGSLVGKSARPAIAIQGFLTEPRTGQSFFEFADKEETKMAVLFFFPNELVPTGQAKYAIREWASQFEKLMSSPPDQRVRDSLPIQILAF